MREKVSIFVDVQNIYYTTKQKFNCNFNYNAFWKQATAGRILLNAFAYAIDRGDPKQLEFQNILRAIGFEVKLKPYITRKDGTSKGDWDVGITIDILKSAPDSDVIVLASGDGDFDLLLKEIKLRYNTDTEVFGVKGLTANSLIKETKTFIQINDELLLR
tara:strand:- start:620 stop:1099 length:480 start_codon:yes stop_codon:yes gene_type:complete